MEEKRLDSLKDRESEVVPRSIICFEEKNNKKYIERILLTKG